MTIEEKAKAYDEAIKYANCLINERCKEGTDGSFHRADLHKMFPQLKESEDEIVIAALKSGINGLLKKEYHLKGIGGISFDRINAWLERKGEQKPVGKIQLGKKYKCITSPRYSTFMKGKIYKPEDKFLCSLMNFCSDCFEPIEDDEQKSTDKVEPKFKVGDWIVWKDKCYKVNYNGCGYELVDQNGLSTSLEYGTIDENAHLWTIQNAKNGDVLALNGEVFIYAHRKQLYSVAVAHCFVDSDGCFYFDGNFGYIEKENPIHPATQEQCGLLFQKITEAGYEWNAEQKELKKIEDEIEIPFGAKDSELQEVTYYIPKGFHAEIDDNKVVIKKGEQKPIDLNTVSIQKLVNVYRNTDEYDEDGNFKGKPVNCMIRAYEQGIRDILKIIKQKDVKPAWSEVDERNMNIIVSVVRGGTHLAYENVLDWFTALKYRVQPRLKQGWKPSDEQMDALYTYIYEPQYFNSPDPRMELVESVYEDLKKLGEE